MKENKDGPFVDLLTQGLAWYIQQPDRQVLPQKQEALRQMIADVLTRRRFKLSEKFREIFHDYPIHMEGKENLSWVPGSPTYLALINHHSRLPIGIIGNALFAAGSLAELTGKEPAVVQGAGWSPTAFFRSWIEQSTDVVLVGGLRSLVGIPTKSGEIIINRLREGNPLAFYPEGTNSADLRKADFKAGRVIYGAATLDIPVFSVGLWYENNGFYLRIGPRFDNERIKELGVSGPGKVEKRRAGQEVADHAMRAIAALLPRELRGYYR